MALKHRLARLEEAVGALGGGLCSLCSGYPFARVQVIHEHNPDGPGYRKTGGLFLAEGDETRVTDDLRCRKCGADAARVLMFTVVGIGPAPEGRRICAV
jgi:hypothetical protein